MSVRLDFLQGIKAEAYTWLFEAMDKMYKKNPPAYSNIVDMIPESEIKGGFYKTTSAIGAHVLQKRNDGQKLAEDRPLDGYTVYGSLKTVSLKIQSPKELERDFKHRAPSWLKKYVQENWAQAIEPTKDSLVGEFLMKGGFTSGDTIFDQSNAALNLSTYTSPLLQYDGKPVFNLSGNTRAAKSGSTYYNGVAYSAGDLADVTDVSYVLADVMKKRLIANAFMENGNPFDNLRDMQVICHPSLADKWRRVNDSEKNPDNANNTANPFYKGISKVIAFPYLTNTDLSIMQSAGKGIKAYFSKPEIRFWEENDPPVLWASIDMDYVLTLQNFRPLVSANAAVS